MPDDTKGPGNGVPVDDDIELIYVGPDGDEAAAASERGLDAVPKPEPEAEVQRLTAEVEQYRDLYLRKLADFDNFRKRLEREREELRRTAGEVVMRELVPVLDNFDRALAHSAESDPASFRQGVQMISRQLWDILRRQGLESLDPLGQPFQPQFHDAVQRVEGGKHEPGTVVSVLAKGYLFSGRLLRPALVAVAVAPSESAPDAGAAGSAGEAEQGP
jgi:molecular chaperone GrpE